MRPTGNTPPKHLVILMLVLVYISWGSVYIGNKLSLEIAGPFLVCGLRNFLAGLLTCGVCMAVRGMWRRPTLRELAGFAALAVLLVGVSGGFLVLGQTRVSSAVAAVVMSATPIVMLVAAFLFAGEPRPNRPQCVGMLTGACAIIYLSASEQGGGAGSVIGVLFLLGAVCGWVAGSLITRKVHISHGMSTTESTGLILLLGGIECLAAGLLMGELDTVRPEHIRFDTVLAFSWMVVGGSFLAYVSYLWLLSHVSVSLAVSYEYVVPVIGIFLGWAIGGEYVGSDMVAACAVSIGSVFLVVRHRHSIRSCIRHYLVRKVQLPDEPFRIGRH